MVKVMRTHVEIRIRLNLNNGKTLHDILRQFARKTKGWKWPSKSSKEYELAIGCSAGYVISDSIEGFDPACVAIANVKREHPKSFDVPNIIAVSGSNLTMEQYNAIGLAFAESFRRFLRQSDCDGIVEICGPEKHPSDIIKGSKCRRLFERYLHCPSWSPSSMRIHPSDIEKLDAFICALFRYGADVSADEIATYLIVDQKWKPADADWIRRRIQTGLEIFRVDRKF